MRFKIITDSSKEFIQRLEQAVREGWKTDTDTFKANEDEGQFIYTMLLYRYD